MKPSFAVIFLAILGPATVDDPAGSVSVKMAAFARGKLGEKVGDGECTTLVNEALADSGGRVLQHPEADGEYRWGELVKSAKDARPGDILQFEKVSFQGRRQTMGDNGEPTLTISRVSFPHHSAIVTAVGPRGKTLTMLHQNGPGPDGHSLRTVQETTLILSEKRPGGSLRIYRPVRRE